MVSGAGGRCWSAHRGEAEKPGVGKLGVDQQLEISRVCSQRYIWQAEERISIRLVAGDVIRTEKKIGLVFSPSYGSTFEALLIAKHLIIFQHLLRALLLK